MKLPNTLYNISNSKKWRNHVILLVSVTLIIPIKSCKKDDDPIVKQEPPIHVTEPIDAVVYWVNLSLYTIRFSAFNTPAYSSRALGYIGLAM